MPMYEYKCAECGTVFERLQKFSDEPLTVHESCGGALERLVSAPAFQFKGTGWYITDYAKKNGSSKNSSDSSGSSSGTTKTESSGSGKSSAAESKPAAPAAKP